ncbi:glycosyltransferase [Candidatus Uhrbacteria bacterium]|nr:glycosyltransferase [Candidatus Uhrbacteria bacterium]
MRILQVNKFFDLQGGAEVYMHGLIDELESRGHVVHAFSTRGVKNIPSRDENYFVTRYHLDRPNDPITSLKIAANFIWNFEAKKAFSKMLDDVKPDVIHLHNIYHYLSTSILSEIRKRNIPCVQTLHDYALIAPNYGMFDHGAPCERSKGGKYYNVILHRCISNKFSHNALAAFEMYMIKFRQSYERTVSIFLCPSRFIKEKMEDWGEPAGKLRYVVAPTDWIDDPAVRGGGYIMFVGRLSVEKGIESFIEASSKVPELPVKIAGRGPLEEKLKALVKERGAHHIEFLGFVAPAELKKLRHRAEAIVLPTLSYENASGVVLEGMASGLPCLVTRTGGNPELVTDGENGFLVKPGDVDDWVRTIRRFLATPVEVRDQMGAKGRERIRARHLWTDHVDAVMKAYRDAGARD